MSVSSSYGSILLTFYLRIGLSLARERNVIRDFDVQIGGILVLGIFKFSFFELEL